MPLAIEVKILPSTNIKPTRVKAFTRDYNVTQSLHSINDPNACRYMALKLCEMCGWSNDLVEGQLPNGNAVFVFKN